MLDPEYLLRISEGSEDIAETLHNDIIQKIIDRIALRLDRGDSYILTAQDKWQLEVLQDAGYLLEDIQAILSQRTGLMQTEIAEAMEDAGVRAISYDNRVYEAAGLSPLPLEQSPYLIRLMQRSYEATLGEWRNFTRTTADAAQQAFIKACDKAYTQVASGSTSYSQAYAEAINDIISDGVTVTYPSGHTDTIETATLRCIRTGVSQATAEITDARMEEMEWDIILVSSHLGARVTDRNDYTNHFWWQGKFYSKSGKDPRFPPFSVCGQGNVQGIHGANCRHSHGPGDGEFNPYDQYDAEENQKEYELQQRQRVMERRIRDSKRKCIGLKEAVEKAGTPEGKAKVEAEYQKQAALLQKRNKAYNDFCEQNDLKKLNERISIAKWDRKQAAQARSAAKKRVADVGEFAATSNWHTIPVAGGRTDTKYRRLKQFGEADISTEDAANKRINENVAKTNPAFKSKHPAYRKNCQRCVATYEMRRRGYDVIAKGAVVNEEGSLSTEDPLYYKWDRIFSGTRFFRCKGEDGGMEDIITKMGTWGDGAVAEIYIKRSEAEAHVFIAERVNGTVRFVDPQTGSTDCSYDFTNAINGATMIARIDNLEPTELIEKCIKNRGGKQ